MTRLRLDETDSTNDQLRQSREDFPGRMTLLTAEYQTKGRGVSGAWQSEKGQNLVFSIMVHPTMVPPAGVFILSQAVCLAICRALNGFVEDCRIKWPNDIYHGDSKLVGILIENDLKGKCISDCIMGVGINVNQCSFTPDAPNPSSLALILGHDVDREAVLDAVVTEFDRLYAQVEEGSLEDIREEYDSLLYRKGATHAYRDAEGEFQATLLRVEPTGHLILRDTADKERRYAFKEVQFII